MNFQAPMFPRLWAGLTALCLFAGAGGALAWGPEGHATIAKVAVEELEKVNPAAAARVKEILEGESLDDAAVWPDDVRIGKSYAGRFASTDEGKAFNTAHPDNGGWHYLDLPLDTKSYAQDKRYISDTDVVAMVSRCADVLEGKSDFLTRKQALRCLIHFVGDMHQPLHVAAGFFKFAPDGASQLITDPDAAAEPGAEKDSGANKLMLDKKLNFHKYCDENLVEAVAPDEEQLAVVLRKDIASIPAATGPWKDWPAQWAMESVEASRKLYGGMLYSKRYPKTGSYWMVYVNFKPGSKEMFQGIIEDRLAHAARHLADILNAIQWAK